MALQLAQETFQQECSMTHETVGKAAALWEVPRHRVDKKPFRPPHCAVRVLDLVKHDGDDYTDELLFRLRLDQRSVKTEREGRTIVREGTYQGSVPDVPFSNNIGLILPLKDTRRVECGPAFKINADGNCVAGTLEHARKPGRHNPLPPPLVRNAHGMAQAVVRVKGGKLPDHVDIRIGPDTTNYNAVVLAEHAHLDSSELLCIGDAQNALPRVLR
eukprot:NODE_581_length_1347_cov_136.281967_g542_i0.p1 GENE.NODE_581_length_1347_cov_136.281967_g542_i0~~NODE_581_length_1347_cov_136.281967_g542_i0.p1  ORF type:complete len:216 (+),score=18.71 NODE_581_length_1347_cov_136.281967_g542_i0:291-938(+)